MKLQQHLYLIQQANALSFLISTHFYDAFYDVNVWRKDTWYLIHDNCYEKMQIFNFYIKWCCKCCNVCRKCIVRCQEMPISFLSYIFIVCLDFIYVIIWSFDQNTIWWHTSFLVILLRHLQQHFIDNTLPRATYNFPNLLRH